MESAKSCGDHFFSLHKGKFYKKKSKEKMRKVLYLDWLLMGKFKTFPIEMNGWSSQICVRVCVVEGCWRNRFYHPSWYFFLLITWDITCQTVPSPTPNCSCSSASALWAYSPQTGMSEYGDWHVLRIAVCKRVGGKSGWNTAKIR